LKLFLSFFKVGLIGFGGGSALIPVIEREIVQGQKMMSEKDYIKHTVIANITPGALPVKLGATCGYQIRGPLGSLISSYSVMLPGVLLTVLLIALISIMGETAISYFNYASIGITAFIVFLLFGYIQKTVKEYNFKVNLIICLAAFAITGGKEIRDIISQLLNIDRQILGTPLFDISTINLMIVAFFAIILYEKLRSKQEFIGMLILCLLYAFSVGKTAQSMNLDFLKPILQVIMVLLIIALFWFRRSQGKGRVKIKLSKKDVAIILVLLLIPVVITLGVQIFSDVDGVNEFMGNVAFSTVTSFGGGEAYVSVADGIFVQGERQYIEPENYYTKMVPIANALPGPILIKIASGIGYVYGLKSVGAAIGWAIALAAAATALGVCCALAILVLILYDNVKDSLFIRNLQLYILPVVCGMLLSTSGAMIYESMKITTAEGIPGLLSFPLIILSIAVIRYLHLRFHLHDIILLLLSAGVSLGAFMII
jgi:chromate transporter